jgi:hypothetical protein
LFLFLTSPGGIGPKIIKLRMETILKFQGSDLLKWLHFSQSDAVSNFSFIIFSTVVHRSSWAVAEKNTQFMTVVVPRYALTSQ